VIVDGAAKLIDFLTRAFSAKELHRMSTPDGRIGHAEVKIGDSPVMISDSSEHCQAMPAAFYLYVPDVDATYKQAVSAGGESTMEPANQFYGDRGAGVKDAFGNLWWIGTHVEDVAPEEMKRRAEAVMKQRQGA